MRIKSTSSLLEIALIEQSVRWNESNLTKTKTENHHFNIFELSNLATVFQSLTNRFIYDRLTNISTTSQYDYNNFQILLLFKYKIILHLMNLEIWVNNYYYIIYKIKCTKEFNRHVSVDWHIYYLSIIDQYCISWYLISFINHIMSL